MKNQDIKNLDEKGLYHGYQERYHSNGELHYKTTYFHGSINGYLEAYYDDKTGGFFGYYKKGIPRGLHLRNSNLV